MQTLQEQYNQIKQGKGNKPHFLKQARHLFPDYLNHYNNYEDTINILKSKSILSENKANLGMVSGSGRKDWFSLFEENIKAEEKKVSQQVLDKQAHAYDNKDPKNIDNVYGNSFLNGFYTEMQDPKNKLKTTDQVKQIVAKNLGKDWNYYAKNAQFGIKGIGYTKEAPGLGEPKEPKGKWKASGYGDLNFETEKVKANTKDTLGAGEAKTTMPKKVAVMAVAPQSSKGVGKMKLPGKPKTIKMQESQIRSVIQQIIKEELNMKEIDNAGKRAEYEAKIKKIDEEILKRKKKLKALTTLEEIEKGSTNKDMMKSLKKEIKTLEALKTKLNKKFTPEEEVIGEDGIEPLPLKEGYGGMSFKDAKEEAQRISKEEGVVQHVEKTEEGSNKYRVSDWYDSDLTVVSYNNGNEQY